jgi:predicted ATPase with chaperone activity
VRRDTGRSKSAASLARGEGITDLYVPSQDASEAALVEGVTVHGVGNLRSLAGHLQGLEAIPLSWPKMRIRLTISRSEAIIQRGYWC